MLRWLLDLFRCRHHFVVPAQADQGDVLLVCVNCRKVVRG